MVSLFKDNLPSNLIFFILKIFNKYLLLFVIFTKALISLPR